MGVPEPKFEEYSGGFAVIFKFKQPIGATIEGNLPIEETLNTRQKTILKFINKVKSASTPQILTEFPELLSKRTLIRDLNYLKSLGLVDSEGKSVSLVWIITNKREE